MLSNANPKVPPGKLSLAEERELKKLMREQGVTAKKRAKKHYSLVLAERAEKELVRERDQRCRWPACICQSLPFGPQTQLEVSHCFEHKGAGGDPLLIRTTRDQMILLCHFRHQGPYGVDSGRSRVVALTDRGTDGPCEFFKQEPNESGRWYSVGISSPPQEHIDG